MQQCSSTLVPHVEVDIVDILKEHLKTGDGAADLLE
jgi:hypothetical protein